MSEPSIFFFEVNERQGVFHRRAFLMGGFWRAAACWPWADGWPSCSWSRPGAIRSFRPATSSTTA
jgi:hypothetical protein